MEISRPSLEERAAECTRELTFSATVAYDGAPFAGFAKQPGQLTVQGELEQALSLLFRRPVDVVCAGRTDAGVHARGAGGLLRYRRRASCATARPITCGAR